MTPPPPPDPMNSAPRGPAHLFLVFTGLAVRGFGGVLPWARRALVDESRWLTGPEFLEVLSLAQALPGPNICHVALMVGERFHGVRGALAALAGLMTLPLGIVISLALLHAQVADHPAAADALAGMGAVSAGLIAGTALTLMRGHAASRTGWMFAAMTFALVGLLRWPMMAVMPALGLAAVLLARARIRK
jgi:chromate transporter